MTSEFKRDRLLQLKLSVEDIAMLTLLTDADGVDISDFISAYIRREYEVRFGKEPLED